MDEVPVTAGNGRTYYVPVSGMSMCRLQSMNLIEVAEVDTS